MIGRLRSRRFLVRLFLSLLLTGLIQVILLGVFTILFSSRLLTETYEEQSAGRMKILVDTMNTTLSGFRDTSLRLSRDESIRDAVFARDSLEKEALSQVYNNLYRVLAGRIDSVSVHLVNSSGSRYYSTHVLPSIYNPNSSEQSLSTYIKLKKDRETFPVVDSFVNPKGDQVAVSLFRRIENPPGESGFIITDLTLESLIATMEPINAGFFSNVYLLDNISYKYVSLYREGDYGNFSRLGFRVPRGTSGVIITDNTLVAYSALNPEELTLAAVLTIGTVKTNLTLLTRMIFLISMTGLILSSLMAYALARSISHPVTVLVEAMNKMEQGELSFQVEEFREDEFDILFHGFNRMGSRIQSLMEARVAREKALHTAERKALQSQINPHFLYNTLNTVKAISKLRKVDEITTIVTQLGKLLRNSIDSEEEFTTIEHSLELVEAYLQIQKIRYGEKFNWKMDVDPLLGLLIIPRLIIQPIVENSVVHGLESLTGDKLISITGRINPPRITVTDNGGGLPLNTWEEALKGKRGVGLRNVQDRLKLYYGDESGLEYRREEDKTSIIIHIKELKGGLS